MRAAPAAMKLFSSMNGESRRGFSRCSDSTSARQGRASASSIGAPRLQEEPIPTMSRRRDGG